MTIAHACGTRTRLLRPLRQAALPAFAVLLFGASSAATIISTAAVEGLPANAVLQFGSPDPGDLSLILQISLAPGENFSIGGLILQPVSAAGTIPGPLLDVTLVQGFGGTTVQLAGTGLSDLFFVSFPGVGPGDQIGFFTSGPAGGAIGFLTVPPLSIPEPSIPVLLMIGLFFQQRRGTASLPGTS